MERVKEYLKDTKKYLKSGKPALSIYDKISFLSYSTAYREKDPLHKKYEKFCEDINEEFRLKGGLMLTGNDKPSDKQKYIKKTK